MTPEEAIERLDSMQSQIIHGKRIFGDIADIIRNSRVVREACLKEVSEALETDASNPSLLFLHRILANNHPDGISAFGPQNIEETLKSKRELELEELLKSAHCIAIRKGEGTAWEEFAQRIQKSGIGSVTARTYRVWRDS